MAVEASGEREEDGGDLQTDLCVNGYGGLLC